MIYNRLGSSGLKVSQLSIGSWVTFGQGVSRSTTKKCIEKAVDGGMNFIDNAEAYGKGVAEEVVGDIVRDMRRESLVLSSKVFWGGDGPNDVGLSRKRVMEACHAALRRLQTDYLDLYFCHRPDLETPVEETCRAMDVLVRQGKVLYWGTSEWEPERIEAAYEICERLNLTPPTMEQPQYNMLVRENVEQKLAPLCERRGLGLTVWSPLASGALTGKYDEGAPRGSRLSSKAMQWLRDIVLTEENVQRVRQLEPIARDLGGTRAQLALAWAAKHPHVSTVITGATKPSQVEENLKALELLEKLDDEVMARIDAVLSGKAEAAAD